MPNPNLTIRNEFAAVTASLDTAGQDPRLALTDLDTGATILLDALTLASLTRLPESRLQELVKPPEE